MMMKSRDVPVQLARGWGGGYLDDDDDEDACLAGSVEKFSKPSALSTNDEEEEDDDMGFGDDDQPARVTFSYASSTLIPPKVLTNDDKLIKLVSIQSFDGAFKVDMVLAQLLDTTLEDIKKGNFN